jgi:RsiW-degrading membrane proteinase PrsW (M82 family)
MKVVIIGIISVCVQFYFDFVQRKEIPPIPLNIAIVLILVGILIAFFLMFFSIDLIRIGNKLIQKKDANNTIVLDAQEK